MKKPVRCVIGSKPCPCVYCVAAREEMRVAVRTPVPPDVAAAMRGAA